MQKLCNTCSPNFSLRVSKPNPLVRVQLVRQKRRIVKFYVE